MNNFLDNFIKGPLTSLFGFTMMILAGYGWWIDYLTDWQAGGAGMIGFALLFMRDKLPGFISTFFRNLIKKFGGGGKMLIIFMIATASVYAQSNDATLSSASTTNIAGKTYSPARADAMFQDIISSKRNYIIDGVASGTDTYTVTAGNSAIDSYVTHATFLIRFTNANTGAATLNINSIGALAIQKNGSALTAGDIEANGFYWIVYDGSDFELLSFSLGQNLTNLDGLAGTGLLVKTGADTWVTRGIQNGNGITVSNGSGVSGNPVINLGGSFSGSETVTIASGSSLYFRFNATAPALEQLTLASLTEVVSQNTSLQQFRLTSGGGVGQLRVRNGSGVYTTELRFDGSTQLVTFTDSRASKRGIEYSADGYVTQARSLADKGYVDSHIGGEPINSLISSPAAGQDGYTITWDNTAGEYTLTDPASATPTLDDILEAGSTADIAATIDVVVNGTGTLNWMMDATGNQHYFQSSLGGDETSVSFRVTDPYMITESGGGWRIQFENEASSWDNIVEGVATIRKTISDGVGANGIGARIFLGAETATENNYRYGFFDFVFSDATYASADGYFSFSPVAAGANVEVLRITGTGLEVNGVALNETDVIDRVSASTAGGTITLDLDSKKQRMFYGSASFATAKTIALSNTTNALVFSFDFSITDLAAVLTMPASFTMDDDRFDGDDWTATETGDYEMVGSLNNSGVWKVKIAGPFN